MTDKDYIAPKPQKFSDKVKRNLMFHIWLKESSRWVWMKFINKLKRDIEIFNHKRIARIAYGSDTADSQEVKDLLKGYIEEFIIHKNQKELGEVLTFPEMLEYVMNGNSDEVTFYGHAKGVNHNPGTIAHTWSDLMYEVNVHYYKKVEFLLQRGFGLVGPFKHNSNRGHSDAWGGHGWHYSGTMFWFRNSEIWVSNWCDILPIYHGVEAWPGRQLRSEHAACLFYEPRDSMYNSNQFNNLVLSAWEKWKIENASYHHTSELILDD